MLYFIGVMEYFLLMLARFFAVTVVLVFHEFAHAFVAYKCGDPTAKFAGRMTINPAKHFDLLGIFAFVFVGFGWAKPVPVNPNNFKDYRKGSFWTSAAGILTNYLTGFLFYPLYLLVYFYAAPAFAGLYAAGFLSYLTYYLFAYSLIFAVFNFLPFYPLDGFRMVDALNGGRGKVYQFLRQYGYYVLLGMMFISMLASYLPIFGYVNVLGWLTEFSINVVGKPITLFWNWIFSLII